MSISLSDLPLEAAQDIPQVDFDNYQDATDFPPPVPDNTYNFKTTEIKLDYKDADDMQKQVRATRELKYLMTHEAYDLQTGDKAGVISFDRISTHVFLRGKEKIPVSFAADMLRACGITQRPTNLTEWGQLLESIKPWCDQGNVWSGVTRWSGYCAHKETQYETQFGADGKPLAEQMAPHVAPFSADGDKKWPLVAGANGSGERNPVMPCPICQKDVQARAKINRRIPKAG